MALLFLKNEIYDYVDCVASLFVFALSRKKIKDAIQVNLLVIEIANCESCVNKSKHSFIRRKSRLVKNGQNIRLYNHYGYDNLYVFNNLRLYIRYSTFEKNISLN